LKKVFIYNSFFRKANFEGANMKSLFAIETNFEQTNFKKANMEVCSFLESNFFYSEFREAFLKNAYFNRCFLSYVDFRGADMRCIDLTGSDLTGALFEGANLEDAVLIDIKGDGRYIKSLSLGGYPIAYTSDVIQIGLAQHKIEKWWDFSEEDISLVAVRDLREKDGENFSAWWNQWKPILQKIIETSPASPTM